MPTQFSKFLNIFCMLSTFIKDLKHILVLSRLILEHVEKRGEWLQANFNPLKNHAQRYKFDSLMEFEWSDRYFYISQGVRLVFNIFSLKL